MAPPVQQHAGKRLAHGETTAEGENQPTFSN